MIHVMDGEFQVFDKVTYIDCKPLYVVIDLFDVQAEDIEIKDIFHKELESIDTESERYINADLDYPCIVIEDMSNPNNKKYRMIDGRHRLLKTIQEEQEDTIECYVLYFEQIRKFIKEFDENV